MHTLIIFGQDGGSRACRCHDEAKEERHKLFAVWDEQGRPEVIGEIFAFKTLFLLSIL